jgi:tetratricopeptide (TPR) repeat protein
MAKQRSGTTKTPARVQVFYFEKKQPGRPTRPSSKLDNPIAQASDPPPRDAPKAKASPVKALREATARVAKKRAARAAARQVDDHSRRITEKIPALAMPHVSAEALTEPENPRLPTPGGMPSSALEALEYHRLKLQELAARGYGSHALANLALYGHALYARGRLDEAQVVFESIVAKEPEEAFAYTMLGAIYLAQDDDARALALFDAALGIEEGDLAALVGRGEIRLRRGQPQTALQDLERAIALDPSGRDPFSERARALSVLARTLSRTLR